MNRPVNETDEANNSLRESKQVPYILLPVYNEERNLDRVISGIRSNYSYKDVRIIAINDGSDDRSLEILEENLGPVDTLHSHRTNLHVGAVFSEGIHIFVSEAKQGDVLIIMESDGTSEIGELESMLKGVQSGNNDVVIASRYRSIGGYERFPMRRKLLSIGANKLMKWRFPIEGVRDYTIFFRAYSFRILHEMIAWYGHRGIIRSQGFAANAELLVKASMLGAKIDEIPFEYDYGKKLSSSKLKIFPTLVEYFSMWTELATASKKIEKYRKINSTQ